MGWNRCWYAMQKEADQAGPGFPPMAATHLVQRVAVEGLWVVRKGNVGMLRVVAVSEVPEAKKSLVLKGLTPFWTVGSVLCVLALNPAFSFVNKASPFMT